MCLLIGKEMFLMMEEMLVLVTELVLPTFSMSFMEILI